MIKALSKLLVKLVASHVELHDSATCPECGSQLARDAEGWGERPREPRGEAKDGSPGVSPHQPAPWHCPNPDCPPQVLHRLELWASPEVMAFQGCDAAVVAQLVQRGLVRDAADYYSLQAEDVTALAGMDAVGAQALVASIAASRQREAWRVLTGLGIPQLGAPEARRLCQHFPSLEALFAASYGQLRQLPDVPEPVIRRLQLWHADRVNRRLLRRLKQAGVNFETCTTPAKNAA